MRGQDSGLRISYVLQGVQVIMRSESRGEEWRCDVKLMPRNGGMTQVHKREDTYRVRRLALGRPTRSSLIRLVLALAGLVTVS